MGEMIAWLKTSTDEKSRVDKAGSHECFNVPWFLQDSQTSESQLY
jgi:hypothetical protein